VCGNRRPRPPRGRRGQLCRVGCVFFSEDLVCGAAGEYVGTDIFSGMFSVGTRADRFEEAFAGIGVE